MTDAINVKIGAQDVGLAATLKTVKNELDGLRSKVASGDMSMGELEKTMRRVGQVESMEKRIRAIGDESRTSAAKVDALDNELTQVGSTDKVASITGSFKNFAAGIAGAYAAMMTLKTSFAFVGDAIKSASDLSETTAKVGQIFGESGKQVEDWAKATSTSFGQSQKQAMDAAATFAIFGKGAGLAGNELVGFSQNLVKLSADFASFYNASPEEAITAIGAALRGESEPIRRFGVLLDDATLKAEAMRMGLYDGTGTLDLQARSLAAYNVILKQTTDAQGDFARTSDGLANQTRILEAEVAQLKAEIGTGLLPSVTTLVTYLNQNTIPALVGAKFYLEEFGKAAGDVAKKTGLTKEGTEAAGFAFKNLSTAAIPALGILFKLKDAQDFLAKKGNEVRDSQKEAAEAINGATRSSNQSAKGFTEAGLAAAAASGEFNGLGSKADQVGESIASAFSLNSDFNSSIDSAAASFGDVNLEATRTGSLLEGNLGLAAQTQVELDAQSVTIAGLNDQLKTTEDLNKSINKISKEKTDAEIAAAAKRDAQLELLRENLELDLGIMQAKATGNKEQEKALQFQKDFNDALKQAKAAGMGENEARAFADQIARAKSDMVDFKNDSALSAKILQDIAREEKAQATDRGGSLQGRAAEQIADGNFSGARRTTERIRQNELDNQIRGVGGDRDRRSLADIGRSMGVNMENGETGTEYRQRIADRIAGVDKPGQDGQKPGRDGVDKPGQDGKPAGDKGKSGGKQNLDGLVDQILKLVQKIEPKLPVAALTA